MMSILRGGGGGRPYCPNRPLPLPPPKLAFSLQAEKGDDEDGMGSKPLEGFGICMIKGQWREGWMSDISFFLSLQHGLWPPYHYKGFPLADLTTASWLVT